MRAYGTALNHISQHKLWGYVVLPGLICLLLGITIFGLAWGLADNIGSVIDNIWRWDWGKGAAEKVSKVFGGLLVLLAGLLIFRQLVLVILSPMMSLLSEKVEKQLKGQVELNASFSISQTISNIVRGLRIVLRNILRELLLTLLLLVLGLIPLFSPVAVVLIFLVQAYYAGFGNMDFALERHLKFRDSIRFIHRNRGVTIGNGTVYLLLLFTFVGFLIALPLGTVAATIETIKRLPKALPTQ